MRIILFLGRSSRLNCYQVLGIFILSLFLFGKISAQNTYQPVPGDTTGYTNGSFNVTDGGAASYSIPIIISPGATGTQPSINLIYSSQGGNGLLGFGWSIQG